MRAALAQLPRRPGTLDLWGASAATAVGLRLLRTGYRGPLATLRRSSDNATKDFYALGNGDFPVAAALAFGGAGTLFVRQLWDQTGGTAHAAQTTNANQPTFVAQVAALGGRCGALFTEASTVCLQVPTSATIDGLFAAGGSVLAVVNFVTAPTVADRIFDKFRVFMFAAAADSKFNVQQTATGNGTWIQTGSAMSRPGVHAVGFTYSSASLANLPKIYLDGAEVSPASGSQPTGTISNDATNDLMIGSGSSGGSTVLARGFGGHFTEFVAGKTIVPAARMAALRLAARNYWRAG